MAGSPGKGAENALVRVLALPVAVGVAFDEFDLEQQTLAITDAEADAAAIHALPVSAW
jgi:hypothetical protein